MRSVRARWRRRRQQKAIVRAARPLLPPVRGDRAALPVRTVHSAGVEWDIHGIAHGQRRSMRMAPEVRAFLAAEVAAWRAAGDGVLLEPGFAKTLGLDGELDLDVGNALALLETRDTLVFLLALVPMLVLLPVAGLLTRLSRDPEWPYARAALRDPRSIVPLARAHELLQPTVEMEEAAPSASERFRRAYSRAMADAARRRAGDHLRVHLVVGLAHVRDLEPLLGAEIPLPAVAAPR
jgi:hypothetical protein